ncbi:hypothetical protein B7Y92_03125 [Candidatus Saccharibacteria bacterium 32-50-13]|nr:MAG: hypothetical protein B7Y92_03125 [Candidatus Saccharibacteria bacterium 32-50-13]
MEVIRSFDETVLLAIRQISHSYLDYFFLAVTELAGVTLLSSLSSVIVIWLLHRKYWRGLILFGFSLGGVMILNVLLKLFFSRTRPDLWAHLVTETSYSFPSGHATASMTIFILSVYLVSRSRWRRHRNLLLVIGSLYVLLIGLSRMYLGVHYPSDIVAGWASAGLWMTLVIVLCHRFEQTRQSSAVIAD